MPHNQNTWLGLIFHSSINFLIKTSFWDITTFLMSVCTKTYSKGSCDIKTETDFSFWLPYKVYLYIKYREYLRCVVFCGNGAQETAVGLIEPSFEMFFQSRCLTSNLLAEREAHLIFASEDSVVNICGVFLNCRCFHYHYLK